MRVAAVQMNVGEDKEKNVSLALELIDRAATEGGRLIVLPEYMTYLGPESRYAEVAEPVPGPTSMAVAAKAREHAVFIHGGSLIEPSARQGKFYNTSYLVDPQGELRAVYQKVHLFDVQVTGEVVDKESEFILPGGELVAVELPEFILGMSICFDVRYPEVYRALAVAGASVLVVPAAFAEATGRVHWEVLLRARAIENHAYVIAAGLHGVCGGSPMYGHSMIVDPWGLVLAERAEGDCVVVADIDGAEALRRRQQIPVLANTRPDVYERLVLVQREASQAPQRGERSASV